MEKWRVEEVHRRHEEGQLDLLVILQEIHEFDDLCIGEVSKSDLNRVGLDFDLCPENYFCL
jgi:hypothetical protein